MKQEAEKARLLAKIADLEEDSAYLQGKLAEYDDRVRRITDDLNAILGMSEEEKSPDFETRDNDLSRLVLACRYLFEDYTMVDDCLGLRTWWKENKHRFDHGKTKST